MIKTQLVGWDYERIVCKSGQSARSERADYGRRWERATAGTLERGAWGGGKRSSGRGCVTEEEADEHAGAAARLQRERWWFRPTTPSDLPAFPDGASGVLRDTRSLFQGGQTKTCQAAADLTARKSASSLAPLLCLITAGNHNNTSARWKEENESLSRAWLWEFFTDV